MTEPQQPALSIVIPARNEARTLPTLVTELAAQFPEAEILVVNDGSTDNTAELLTELPCRVIHNPYSMGNGAAIKRGSREAQGEILALMDGDGQHRPDQLARVLDKFHSGEYDLVVGARRPEHHATRWRRAANGFFNRLASWMTGQRVLDLTSGLRVTRTRRFREFLYLLPNGFSYPTTSTMAFFRSGYSVGYQPVEVVQRDSEASSHIRPLQDGMRFIIIILRIGSLYSPLKLFLPVSLMLFAVASVLYGYTFFTAGRFTNMSALLYTTSLLTFLIGMVAEQITTLTFAHRSED
jgi:glycosyltransferase involved in cell wall biosynthesis